MTLIYCPFARIYLPLNILLTQSGTVAVVKKLVGEETATEAPAAEPATEEPKPEANGVNGTNGEAKEDADKAEVAAEVADTAEKLDSNEAKPVAA
jgi:peroxiredoxin Q/BCP